MLQTVCLQCPMLSQTFEFNDAQRAHFLRGVGLLDAPTHDLARGVHTQELRFFHPQQTHNGKLAGVGREPLKFVSGVGRQLKVSSLGELSDLFVESAGLVVLSVPEDQVPVFHAGHDVLADHQH